MIGIVYTAKDMTLPTFNTRVLKVMFIEKMIEKKLVASIMNEIEILNELKKLKGFSTLLDIYHTDRVMVLIFPYYHSGDLY